MEYTEYEFFVEPGTDTAVEIIIAHLSQLSFQSFVETDRGFYAYIESDKVIEQEIENVLFKLKPLLGKVTYTKSEIEQQNWNETWEKSFSPIIVDDKCIVYAPFHKDVPKLEFNILIEPKMAFGTGHHATTFMMMKHLLSLNVHESKVLDMGSGTGILAILASMKGADIVYAVDNDHWAYQNCLENIKLNHCDNIIAIEGDTESVKKELFDLIMANINRNTLISDISKYVHMLKSDGMLVMSGFYVDDIAAVEQEANAYDLFLKEYLEKDNWASVVFSEKYS